jgi:beta-galactosidase
VWENVVYQPGTLEVRVKKDGKPWAKATRSTTGKAVEVEAVADRDTIAGDGQDLSYISLSLVDSKGRVVPTDCRDVSFSITGPAKLVGFCNGNQTDHTSMVSNNQRFFNGRIVAVVRGSRGKTGEAVVKIKAEGLPETRASVMVKEESK